MSRYCCISALLSLQLKENVCRILWLSFLLFACVGSIPVQQGRGCWFVSLKLLPMRLNYLFPGVLPYWSSGSLASSQGSGPHQSVLKPNFKSVERLAQSAASRADPYNSPQSAYWGQDFVGNPDYAVKYPEAPGNNEDQGPFFTDLSALTPIYASSSRSRYHRGRAVFAQTHYIPGDPVYPSMPVIYHYSQRSGGETGPADVSKKGSF